jgi:hypothetical protein
MRTLPDQPSDEVALSDFSVDKRLDACQPMN